MSTPSPTDSATAGRKRLSLIWIIPLVTLLIGAYLVWDTYSKRGPLVTVSWQAAQGLVAGQSRVRHKDVDIGLVTGIKFSGDLSRVVITIRMNQLATPLLTTNAQLWVVSPRFFAGSLSGLGTLLSGSYIELTDKAPGGTSQRKFVGLEDPPLLQADVAGREFLLDAPRIGSISVGSPIFYRDLSVGQVLGWDLGDLAKTVKIHAFVRAPFDQYVHNETRFWNASGVSVKLGGGGVQVELQSFKSLLLGGVAFGVPDGTMLTPSDPTKGFKLYANLDAANAASYQREIQIVSFFPGSVAGLVVGSAVTFQGLHIGEVTSVGLTYDPVTDTIRAPVTYNVEPERITNVQVMAGRGPLANARELVKRGLRAQVKSKNLITGEMEVSLEIMPDAAPAALEMNGRTLVIPAVAGGLAGLTNSVGDLLVKLNQMPFAQIGKNLNATLAGTSQLTNGPEVAQTLQSLNGAVLAAKDLLQQFNADGAPALQRLPEIAAGLQVAVTQVNKVLGSVNNGYGDDSSFQRQLSRLMAQMNETAQSFKALSDLLARHPEALIHGRSNTGME